MNPDKKTVKEEQDDRPVLAADGIRKSFRNKHQGLRQVLNGISLEVRAGSITALVGPDGAGKTTALRIMAGLLSFDAGKLEILGRTIQPGEHVISGETSYMPQKFGLYEDLTVQENLDLYADLRGLSVEDRKSRYDELLEMSAMKPFRARLAGKLSGGMKQKLGLMCTLVNPPRLLLLDEPTVGVDPVSRKELWDIIKKSALQTKMAVLMSTSYLDEAEKCDHVILLMEGSILDSGSPEAVGRHAQGMAYLAAPSAGDTPRSLQARLFSLPGVIDATPQGGEVRYVHGDLTPDQQREMDTALAGAIPRPAKSTLEDSFMLLLRKQKAKTGQVMQYHPRNPPTQGSKPVPSQEDPVIETKGVYRCFGDFIAVNNVSFTVNRGEVFGLLGPNGAGKTTTFRMLCGLLPASRGTLIVAGIDVRKAREKARQSLGYIAQKFSLYGTLTVKENLEFFAGAYGLRGRRKEERITEMIREFSLEENLDKDSGDLPGGYKQRLAMAVGLIHEPLILFLDEPTSGADPLARREFWQRITFLAEKGVTIIVTTHFMEEAEYCDRVIIQSDGIALAMGTPAEIRTKEGHTYETMEDAFIAIVEKGRNEKKQEGAK